MGFCAETANMFYIKKKKNDFSLIINTYSKFKHDLNMY